MQLFSQATKLFYHVGHSDNDDSINFLINLLIWSSIKKDKNTTLKLSLNQFSASFAFSLKSGQGSQWGWCPCGVVLTQSFSLSSCIHELDSCTAFLCQQCNRGSHPDIFTVRAKEHTYNKEVNNYNNVSLVRSTLKSRSLALQDDNQSTNQLRKWVIAWRGATSESRDLQQIFMSVYVKG